VSVGLEEEKKTTGSLVQRIPSTENKHAAHHSILTFLGVAPDSVTEDPPWAVEPFPGTPLLALFLPCHPRIFVSRRS
jgi:hypothetical protein